MKRLLFIMGAVLLLTAPLPALTSLDFSTKLGSTAAWELRWTGTNWRLSFVRGATVVDSSNPADATLDDDFVMLPTMDLSNVQDFGTHLTATLTPRGSLEINSNPSNSAVMMASVGSGGMLSIGANYVAYSNVQDDLNITFHNPNYGQVIPQLVADENRGLMLDMSFSGDATGSVNLHDLILTRSGRGDRDIERPDHRYSGAHDDPASGSWDGTGLPASVQKAQIGQSECGKTGGQEGRQSRRLLPFPPSRDY